MSKSFSDCVFNVLINGSYIEKSLNLTNQCGTEKAVSIKYKIEVICGTDISIDFESVKGEPILSAIQIRKIL